MSGKAIEAAARALLRAGGSDIQPEDTVASYHLEMVTVAVQAYLAAMEAEGFVMVPVEATEGMLEGFGIHKARMAENYRAMLAARPQPKD